MTDVVTSSIDLSPVLTPALQLLGIVILAVGTWLARRLAVKLGIEANGLAMQNLDDAAAKAVQAAVMATQNEIKTKGWDHVDTQSAQIAYAAGYVVDKFKTTLADSGLDPSTIAGAAAVKDIVTRKLPEGVAIAAASPATPPVPATEAKVGP